MNWRNVRIFGIRGYRGIRGLKINPAVFIGALIVLGFAGYYAYSYFDLLKFEELKVISSGQVTGGAVQQTSGEAGAEESSASAQQEKQQQQEEKEYFEYSGKCAFDIEKSQDDISDINEYAGEFQKRFDELSKEMTDAITEIEAKYSVSLESLRKKIEEGRKDLEGAQERYEQVKRECEK